jgi:hypothetical protein
MCWLLGGMLQHALSPGAKTCTAAAVLAAVLSTHVHACFSTSATGRNPLQSHLETRDGHTGARVTAAHHTWSNASSAGRGTPACLGCLWRHCAAVQRNHKMQQQAKQTAAPGPLLHLVLCAPEHLPDLRACVPVIAALLSTVMPRSLHLQQAPLCYAVTDVSKLMKPPAHWGADNAAGICIQALQQEVNHAG